MNSAERTVVAATRAYGEIVREIRPLDLTPGPAPAGISREPGGGARGRRLRSWLIPATAAAAVVALAIALVIIRDIPNGRVVSPPPPATASGVPPYYVALTVAPAWYAYPLLGGLQNSSPTAADLVVGETFTGKLVATVKPPRGATFFGVTAAADDRTFIVDAGPLRSNFRSGRGTWYLLRLTPGGTPAARLVRLPIPGEPAAFLTGGIAVSPDGTELAVASLDWNNAAYGGQAEILRIYSVATGALLHTWGARLTQSSATWLSGQATANQTSLFWIDGGRQLAFDYGWATGNRSYIGVRVLDPARPGHDLLDDSRLAWSHRVYSNGLATVFPFDCDPRTGPLVVADGTAVDCAATGQTRDPAIVNWGDGCPAIPPWSVQGFLEFSTAGATAQRTVFKLDTTCMSGDPGSTFALWVSPSGDTVAGYVGALTPGKPARLGVFTSGGRRLLPPIPGNGVAETVAW
jgi:hypothetical protein